MNKIDAVDLYYRAWVKKDIELLSSNVLSDEFGIRNFFKAVIFNLDEIETEFRKFSLLKYSIEIIEELENVLYCNLIFDYEYKYVKVNRDITAKFAFKDNKITRVYEIIDNPKYTRIKCTISYDGSIYSGFQRQLDLRTVQGDIEKALKYLTNEDITIQSSGRTDKGVHALNQVIHFDTLSKIEPENFARVLKSYLPDSIYIKSSSKEHKTFHSRYDVFTKEYVYVINYKEYNPIQRNYEWFMQDFDLEILTKELNKLIGTHDFTSFTKTTEDKIMVREIKDVKIRKTDTHIYISIIGKGFLRYMVRYLVGTLIEIAQGKSNYSITDFIDMKNSSEVVWKAPSSGLYLKEVIYYE
ncbi:MAG: tRNA pseudouridine(38-40) synthase TruA [Candidatus Izimaplasma sp.]|nr:tRNA pseudouridine(38-40) synthase TruA [Candidatus Izimaplasma bacterium]